MQVVVLFFGGLREILACRQTVAECEGERVSLATVRSVVERQFPTLRPFQANTRLALNEQLLSEEDLGTAELVDGDVLAYLPPVTGG